MKKKIKIWVRAEYPQKAEQIVKHSLSEKKIREAGIELRDHEIFVHYKWGYYGSNYGRLISTKYGKMSLREESRDGSGHVIYSISKPAPRHDGEIVGKPKQETFSGQWIVGKLFLPNYWPNCTRRQLEVHHLDKCPWNNKWDNLILLPVWLHKLAEKVDSYWLLIDGQFCQKKPYDITDLTGLTLEEVIYALRRKPDFVIIHDRHQIEIYEIGKYQLGYELNNPYFGTE